jgi:hypothetical protein
MITDAPAVLLVDIAAGLGLALFCTGIAIGILAKTHWLYIVGVATQSIGAAVFFPVAVSFAYDRLREKWLGDEVWRLFGELADAGIARVYPDREYRAGQENGQRRLAEAFTATHEGEVRLMGPTLKAFFHTSSPLYSAIEQMLRDAKGAVTVRALIEREDSQAIRDRIEIEQPELAPGEESQTKRDCDTTLASILTLERKLKCTLKVRRYNQAPYCTAVLLPDLAFFSPNLLASEVPVRLPLLVFKAGWQGYRMIKSSFKWMWDHKDTTPPAHVAPASIPVAASEDNVSRSGASGGGHA